MNKLFSSRFKSMLNLKILIYVSILFIGCTKDENNPAQNIENYDIAGYNLVWQDEFSGSNIDESKWEHEVNAGGGGNWPGSPDETTVFPQEMVIDYVRVYKKK